MNFDQSIKERVEKARHLIGGGHSSHWAEAATLLESVLHDTAGGKHPSSAALVKALTNQNWASLQGICRAIVALYDTKALANPRLNIAHEIEGNLLDVAEEQIKVAASNRDTGQKQMQLAIGAFLAGAALEDALRRLCDAHQLQYDAQKTSISKLQAALYQPAKQIEVISSSETKQITAWGDTRNKADHGKFGEITETEVTMMVMGVRSFIDKHLP
jgi:hypothetical protein